MLTASHITKKFGDKVVLNDISFEAKPGTITSIIGPSGSGKTTLLKALSLLDFPQGGTITIDDFNYTFPLVSSDIIPPWPGVSVVFQQLFIWPHLTLRKNIELPLEIRGILKESEGYLNELYAFFGMKEFLDRFPNEASIGQRQRVALVRALALKPRYLLLDEITSSLDVEQINSILAHLKDVRDLGVCIVIVTHLINFAEEASDRIIFLDDGCIVEHGGKEILKDPRSPRLQKFLSMVRAAS